MPLKPTDRKKILQALETAGSVKGAYELLGGTYGRNVIRAVSAGKYDGRRKKADEATGEGMQFDGSKDAACLTMRSRTIRTLEAALDVAKVDLEIWEVERYVVNKWDMGAKIKAKQVNPYPDTVWRHKISVTELWQVKVWLRRKVKTPQLQAIEALVAQRQICFKPTKYRKGNRLLEVSLFDMHFGKLAWEQETGSNYDLKIAAGVFATAIDQLLDVGGDDVSEILLPIGQDFFHINNPQAITPKGGNLLDTDGRLAKVFQVGYEAVIAGINRCLEVAPVRVIWVPGNHDPETSLYLIHVLNAWYRTNKHVEIDIQPTVRKYVRFGVNLLGFTHGDEECYRDLPTIMAAEQPQEWSTTRFREWHLGHWHKMKQISYLSTDSYGGVVVRVLPSLSGTDAWHYRKGFVKSRRAAEAYLWDSDAGYIGHFAANLPQEISDVKPNVSP